MTRYHANPEIPRIVYNPSPAHFSATEHSDALAFHRKLPGYGPTPLVAAPGVAAKLGVGQVWVKDESHRLGLPAYKILGASWAAYRALDERYGPFTPWETLPDLAAQLLPSAPLTLVAATDGNHGRAVARMAKWLGVGAHILVPRDMAQARRQAIESEGAQVTVVNGSYDEAVEASARLADDAHLVISDTSWEGYEHIPAWVIEGYATIFQEIDAQLAVARRATARPRRGANRRRRPRLLCGAALSATGLGDAGGRRRADPSCLCPGLRRSRWTDRGTGPA